LIRPIVSVVLIGLVTAAPAIAQVVKPATPATRPVAPKVAVTKLPTPAAKPPSLNARPEPGSASVPTASAKTSLEEAQAELAALKARMKTTTGTSVQDLMAMQQMMVRKGQLETMISNTLKAGEAPASKPAEALKAS